MATEQITDEDELARLREVHNPDGKPTGPFTKRCIHCGSDDFDKVYPMCICKVCHDSFSILDLPTKEVPQLGDC